MQELLTQIWDCAREALALPGLPMSSHRSDRQRGSYWRASPWDYLIEVFLAGFRADQPFLDGHVRCLAAVINSELVKDMVHVVLNRVD